MVGAEIDHRDPISHVLKKAFSAPQALDLNFASGYRSMPRESSRAPMLKDTYNERLFQRRFRRFLHIGRFQWLARRVASHDPAAETIVELGCYDGRVLEHLDHKPKRYVGYDANWERGLDLARARWSGHPEYEFRMVVAASDVNLEERFDIGVCMETLEHLPPEAV